MADGTIDVKVDISELDGYFAQITEQGRVKQITRKALRKGAKIVQAAIQERAPVRPDLPSGTALPIGALANDIVIRSFTDSDGKEAVSIQPGDLTNHVAGWVEFGHQMVTGGYRNKATGRGPGKITKTINGQTFVPAHPFFRPGEEASIDEAAEVIADSLSTDLIDQDATGDAEAA